MSAYWMVQQDAKNSAYQLDIAGLGEPGISSWEIQGDLLESFYLGKVGFFGHSHTTLNF